MTEIQTFSSSNVKERPNENKTKSAWWRASLFLASSTLAGFFYRSPKPCSSAAGNAPVSSPIPDTGCSDHPPYNQPGDGVAAFLTEGEQGLVNTGRNESVNVGFSECADVPFEGLLINPK